jgi:hypothetical protein
MEPVRRRTRGRSPESGPSPTVPAPAPPPKPAAPSVPEPMALQLLKDRPLEASLYRSLALAFHGRGEAERGALMEEVADALEGQPTAAPPVPALRLSAEDRAGLRHPGLRTSTGELLTCVGPALCRLFPAYGPAAGTNELVRPGTGPGAPAALEALEAAARILDIRPPEVVVAEESGPPFSLVHTSAPRVLVGRQAVQQPVDADELRFHAGRVLFSLAPDLLVLRCLKKDQLLRGLAYLSALMSEGDAPPAPEGRVLRDSLPPQMMERAAKLFESGTRQMDLAALAEAARHSTNRAGLVACGSVGTALAVLRARRALEAEVVELVRFATSERYLQLRLASAG